MEIILTKHAKEQIAERGISENEVINTIIYLEMLNKIEGVYYARKRTISGIIEVVYIRENYIKVITSYLV